MSRRSATAKATAARARLVSRLNRGIGLLAGRAGLTVKVNWDAQPHEPPAWIDQEIGQVTLNGPIALDGADPAMVNPTTPAGRRKHPILVGLLCHEGSHGHSTQWPADFLTGLPPEVVLAIQWLEEPRIERRQLDRRPGDRLYLRASSRLVTLSISRASSVIATRWHAAQALVLTTGRADAGVLRESEVRRVLTLCRRVLGEQDLEQLRELARRAVLLADGDTEGLLEVARQWVEVVGQPEPGELPAPPCALGPATTTESGDQPGADTASESAAAEPTSDNAEQAEPAGQEDADGDSDQDAEQDPDEGTDGRESEGHSEPEQGQPEEQDVPGGDPTEQDALTAALAAALAVAMTRVGESGVQEATNQLREDEAAVPVWTAQRQPPDPEQVAAEQAAVLVFGGHGHTDDDDNTDSPLGQPREPTAEERALARRTGEALRRAQFRERGRVLTPSTVPPGRLVGREAVQGAAQRARGVQVTARPFRQVQHSQTPQPPLTVGIAMDVSGSMWWAQDVMSTMAWVLAHAVAQVGGRSAMVAFGAQVTAVTRPGPPPRLVPTFVADDNWERFTDAIRALDGGLALTTGTGARLVFVVSDGHYTDEEKDSANRLVPRLLRHGVQVVWLDISQANNDDYYYEDDEDEPATCVPAGAVHIPIANPADIPQQIRTVLVKALRTH